MAGPSDKKTLPAGSFRPIVVPPAQGSTPAAITLSPPFPKGSSPPAVSPIPPAGLVPDFGAERGQDVDDDGWVAAAQPESGAPADVPVTRRPEMPPPRSRRPGPPDVPAPVALDWIEPKAQGPAQLVDEPPADLSFGLPECAPFPAASGPIPDPDAANLGPPALAPPRSALDVVREPAEKGYRFAREQARRGLRIARERVEALTPGQRKLALFGTLGGAALVLVVGSTLALVSRPSLHTATAAGMANTRRSAPEPAPAPAPVESEPAPARSGPRGACVRAADPVRLSAKVSKDVPIELRASTDQTQVALGFAMDGRTAAGLVLQVPELGVKQRFRKATGKIGRVIPAPQDEGFSFQVHAAGHATQSDESLTVNTQPALTVAWSKDGLRVTGEGVAEDASWKLEQKPSAVRAIATGTRSAAIAVRAGDAVHLAWLGEDGRRAGELSRVQSAGVRVGSPSIGWNGSEVLIAFAERENNDAPWSIRVARARMGTEPWSSQIWTAPGGGPGGQVIAPSIAALDGGGWLMIWTEGNQGRREVRIQTLDSDLQAVGEAQTVSSQDNAGQGSGIVAAERGVVVYLAGARAHELWAASIGCP